MGLQNIAIIYEQHEISKRKFDDITSELKNDFCFTSSIAIQDSTPFSVSKHVNVGTSDSILVIVENPSVLESVGEAILKESDDLPSTVIFSIAKVGSIIWPRKPNQNVVILQMTSALNVDDLATNMDSSLLHEWIHQRVTDCAGGNSSLNARCTSVYTMDVASSQQDWSLLPLHYGILLYASAVRITRAACTSEGACNLNSKWLSTLAQASLFVKPENSYTLSQRISFGMAMSSRFLISSVQKNGDYVQVGEIEGGLMKLRTDFKFPPSIAALDNATVCGPPQQTVSVNKKEKPLTTQVFISSAEESILDFFEKMGDAEGYQLIGMLAGCCTCIIVIFLIAFCSVYRSVNPKSSARSTMSSKNSTISDDS
uniref:Uncharacterized protein n=1 Tax=Lygus hesperus TaxID=30085 RepID=A0A0A9XVS0_LYGHE